MATCSRLRSEEHTSELQSLTNLVCRLLLEKKNDTQKGLLLYTATRAAAEDVSRCLPLSYSQRPHSSRRAPADLRRTSQTYSHDYRGAASPPHTPLTNLRTTPRHQQTLPPSTTALKL